MGWQGPLIGRKGWGPQTSCLIPFQWQKGPAGLLEEPANLSQSSNSHECSCRDMKRNLIKVIKKTLWGRLLEVTLAPLSPPLCLWTLFVGVDERSPAPGGWSKLAGRDREGLIPVIQ